MLLNNYLKCIPFYTKKEYQYFKETNDDTLATWLCPKNLLLPFQIIRNRRPYSPRNFNFYLKLINYRTAEEVNLMDELESEQVQIFGANAKDLIIFYATQEMELECGLYYYELYDGFQKFYSEAFRVVDYEIDIDSTAIIDDKEIDLLDASSDNEELTNNNYVSGINFMQ